jgi:hypothetical protein
MTIGFPCPSGSPAGFLAQFRHRMLTRAAGPPCENGCVRVEPHRGHAIPEGRPGTGAPWEWLFPTAGSDRSSSAAASLSREAEGDQAPWRSAVFAWTLDPWTLRNT